MIVIDEPGLPTTHPFRPQRHLSCFAQIPIMRPYRAPAGAGEIVFVLRFRPVVDFQAVGADNIPLRCLFVRFAHVTQTLESRV